MLSVYNIIYNITNTQQSLIVNYKIKYNYNIIYNFTQNEIIVKYHNKIYITGELIKL